MYNTISDLPFVCQLNLPEPALHVYRDAFNRAWRDAAPGRNRFAIAQNAAWSEVRRCFARDPRTGRWDASVAEPRPIRKRPQLVVEPAALAS